MKNNTLKIEVFNRPSASQNISYIAEGTKEGKLGLLKKSILRRLFKNAQM